MVAVLSDPVAAGLCGVYAATVQKPPYTIVYCVPEDPEIIYTGIRRAVSTVVVSGAPFHQRVESCVANYIAERSAEFAKELRQLKPRDLLER